MTNICEQCEANARTNEAGGYKRLAEECRQYCLNGHVYDDNPAYCAPSDEDK